MVLRNILQVEILIATRRLFAHYITTHWHIAKPFMPTNHNGTVWQAGQPTSKAKRKVEVQFVLCSNQSNFLRRGLMLRFTPWQDPSGGKAKDHIGSQCNEKQHNDH